MTLRLLGSRLLLRLMLAEAIKRNPKACRIQAKTTETKKNHSETKYEREASLACVPHVTNSKRCWHRRAG